MHKKDKKSVDMKYQYTISTVILLKIYLLSNILLINK